MTRREAIEEVKREYEKTNGKPLLFTFTTSSGETYPPPLRTVQAATVDEAFRLQSKNAKQHSAKATNVVGEEHAQLVEARLVEEDALAATMRVHVASEDAKKQKMLRERAGDSDLFEMGVPIPKPKRRTQRRPAKRAKRK